MRLPRASAGRGALLFGVTPELATIDWQPPFDLLAVDQSEAMIAAVWPGDTHERRAIKANWFDLPVQPSSIDLAMGDGCFSALDYPDGYDQLARSLGRVVRRGGLFSIRLFCRSDRAETVDEVFEALQGLCIENFHAFKWRLAMALQGDDIARGVVLADIWSAFRERVPKPEALAAHTGWPLSEVETIDNYRSAQASYTYPTVAEVDDALRADFELVDKWRGSYPLAERCPQVLFCRR